MDFLDLTASQVQAAKGIGICYLVVNSVINYGANVTHMYRYRVCLASLCQEIVETFEPRNLDVLELHFGKAGFSEPRHKAAACCLIDCLCAPLLAPGEAVEPFYKCVGVFFGLFGLFHFGRNLGKYVIFYIFCPHSTDYLIIEQ